LNYANLFFIKIYLVVSESFIYICIMSTLSKYFTFEKQVDLKYKFLKRYNPKTVLFDGLKWEVCFDTRITITHQKPIGSGIYIITKRSGKGKRKVMYVGACRCFSVRLSTHEKMPAIRKTLLGMEYIEILCYETKDYKKQEKEFIKRYMPPFNKAHNPKLKKVNPAKYS